MLQLVLMGDTDMERMVVMVMGKEWEEALHSNSSTGTTISSIIAILRSFNNGRGKEILRCSVVKAYLRDGCLFQLLGSTERSTRAAAVIVTGFVVSVP